MGTAFHVKKRKEKNMKKRIFSLLLAVALCLAWGSMVYAVEPESTNLADGMDEQAQIEKFEEEFDQLFPEYVERMNLADSYAKSNEVLPAFMSEGQNDTMNAVETITRYKGDDVYTLSLFPNGGYSKVVLAASSSVNIQDGTDTGDRWMNRKVYATIADPGLVSYSGGMIGDTICYSKSGSFVSTSNGKDGHGHYMNAGVLPGYETNVAFLERKSSSVKVIGKATGISKDLNGQDMILTKDTLLTISLNPNADPTVTFKFNK